MAKFWVEYEVGNRRVTRPMTGLSNRHIAVEIREKNPAAKIKAIKKVSADA